MGHADDLFGARSFVPWGFAMTAAAAAAVIGPMMFTAWPVFRVTHAAYVVAGVLPVSYMGFLERARAGGILAQGPARPQPLGAGRTGKGRGVRK
jgi:hypothetical protein